MDSVFRLQLPEAGAPLPKRFSYSALTEIDHCPRRWWLRHGHYDGLLGPYPEPVYAATMVGTIVHGALEAFADALQSAGNPAAGSTVFVGVRRTFLVREIVRRLRREALSHLANNPRVDTATLGNAISVDECIAAFKRLVTQAYANAVQGQGEGYAPGGISEVNTAATETDSSASVSSMKAPDAAGPDLATLEETNGQQSTGSGRWSHPDAIPCPAVLPEVKAEITDPPLRGTIDLVVTGREGDTMIEFKTGAPRPEHERQSAFYAVLWWLWTGRQVQQRLLVYADREPVLLNSLAVDELTQETASIRERVARAQADLSLRPPPARPSFDKCSLCPVRQLCEEYWHSPATVDNRWTVDSLAGLQGGETASGWRDIELDSSKAEASGNGFSVEIAVPGSTGSANHSSIRLACSLPAKFHPSLVAGTRRARLLGVALRREGGLLRVIWSRHSEVFFGPV